MQNWIINYPEVDITSVIRDMKQNMQLALDIKIISIFVQSIPNFVTRPRFLLFEFLLEPGCNSQSSLIYFINLFASVDYEIWYPIPIQGKEIMSEK